MEVVSGDNWSYKSCKAPVKMSPPTNQHRVFLQAGCPTNNVKALNGTFTLGMGKSGDGTAPPIQCRTATAERTQYFSDGPSQSARPRSLPWTGFCRVPPRRIFVRRARRRADGRAIRRRRRARVLR